MSALTIQELKKHKYLETFVNNFEKQNCFVLNNGKKFSFKKTDKINKDLFNAFKQALKEGTGNGKATKSLALAESIVKRGKQYIFLTGNNGLKVKFSDISKFNVSGLRGKTSGADTAAKYEGGVYLRLCEYLGQKPLESSDPKIKKDFEVAVTGLADKEIFEICDKQAKNIINKCKLKNKHYKILWREQEYKKIRDTGYKFFKELYNGAQSDKWTPADIIIGSKTGIEKAINSKSLIEINKLFEIQNNKFGELIGVSLKKGEGLARLGSGGFDRILSILSPKKVIKQKPVSYKNIDILFKEQKQFWSTKGKRFIQKVGIPVYFIVQKDIIDSKSTDFSELQESTRSGLEKTITNVRAQGSIIEFLEFLSSGGSEDLDFKSIFDSIYKFCKSIFPLSANYVLEDGSSTLKVLGNESKSKTFKAKALYINMNGFGKMFIEYENGTQIELRNKGTVQFEINTSQKYTNSVLANTFKF